MKLTIITHDESVAGSCMLDLQSTFQDIKGINGITELKYINTMVALTSRLDSSNLYLFTNTVDENNFRKRFNNFNTLTLHRRIKEKSLKLLLEIPEKTEILLVNNTYENCIQTIDELNNRGFSHLVFYPFYPDASATKKITIAVTPGEINSVPAYCTKVIDLEHREISIKSIIKILNHFNLLSQNTSIIERIIDKNAHDITKLYALYSKNLQNYFNGIIDGFDYGYILLDDNKRVIASNIEAQKILNANPHTLIGKHIESLIPNWETEITAIRSEKYFLEVQVVNNELGTNLHLHMRPVEKIIKQEKNIRLISSNKADSKSYNFEAIVGDSEALKTAISLAKKFSNGNGNILIEGESGTGKEVFARAIHYASDRKNMPFIPVNFASMTPSILESELFGYEEGSFTGAKKGGKSGLFEAANGGTLFLDEIGDASLEIQTHLLRVLQDQKIRRIGGIDQIPVDVRIISATNRPLWKMVTENTFRHDLFYRISVLPITLPALKARKGDIVKILNYYLTQKSDNIVKSIYDIATPDLINFIECYSWPGNIREAINLTEYLVNTLEINQKATVINLPYFMKNVQNDSKDDEPIASIPFEEQLKLWILNKLYLHGQLGRRKLLTFSEKEGKFFSEGVIRNALELQRREGNITFMNGSAGSMITPAGIDYLKSNNNHK